MIQIDLIEAAGFRAAIKHAMRNPMNSWDRSDTLFVEGSMIIGDNDYKLMKKLFNAGEEHRTYLRQIICWVDIKAPRYWWTEMDRYTVGKSQVSCSTMHTIQANEFTTKDFSCEHINGVESNRAMETTINALNRSRESYLEDKSKKHWWNMIQLLPQSYMQLRTVCMSYEVLAKIWKERRNHKLDEWKDFCEWMKVLPMSEIWTEVD